MTRQMTTLMAVLLSALSSGCAGSADDLCSIAAQHLEACTGTVVNVPTNCNQANAGRVLNADCAALAAQGNRGTFFFNQLWDWMFGGGGDEGDGDWHGEGEGDWHGEGGGWYGEGGGECHCDQVCTILDDCCEGCGGAQNECSCDYWCGSKGNCCEWCEQGDHGGYLEEGGGGGCAYQGGTHWRRCNDCGWQFCLSNGTWADCQRPASDPNKFGCGGGYCRADGFCQ